ncbi:MAG: hypothetical protein Q8N53_02040, partial [Longimicrobiales bacterium]|nr:hypothetical protein [Longimicrobiales bacterium]
GTFIDCGAYPEAERYTRCYRQLLAQLTPEMYAALSTPPPPVDDWRKMMGVATTMLVVGAVGTTMVKVARERR